MPNYKSNCKVIGNSITVTVIDPALVNHNENIVFGPLHFNITLAYFSVDFGLRETSAAFNSPGKLHGRSVRWLPGLGLGVGQVRTKNGYDGCDCHSGEVVKKLIPSPLLQ